MLNEFIKKRVPRIKWLKYIYELRPERMKVETLLLPVGQTALRVSLLTPGLPEVVWKEKLKIKWRNRGPSHWQRQWKGRGTERPSDARDISKLESLWVARHEYWDVSMAHLSCAVCVHVYCRVLGARCRSRLPQNIEPDNHLWPVVSRSQCFFLLCHVYHLS